MSHLKGIAFESRDELEELRKRLSGMSDEQLVRFGKAARSLCRHRDCPETFKRQLEEARAEWRRRHPKHRGSAENP
jgi:hypothetical protein